MKKLFTLLTLLVFLGGGKSWGADVTLFTTNFSTDDGWSSEDIITSSTTSNTKTIKGIVLSFKGYKSSNLTIAVGATSSAAGTLTFTGNNLTASEGSVSGSNPNYYMAIPLTGVNGSITVTYAASSKFGVYYTYDDGNTGNVIARVQDGNNNDKTFTISGLTSSNVTLYIGTKEKAINGLTITTPDPSPAPELDGANSSPVADATDIAVSGAGFLKFNKDLTSVDASKITISPSSNGESLSGIAIDDTDASKVNYTWSNLLNETEYTINIAADAVSDGAKSNTAGTLSFNTAKFYKNDFTDGQVIWTTTAVIDAACAGTGKWMVKGANMSGTKDLGNRELIDPEDESQMITKYSTSTDFYVQNTSTSSQDRALYMYVTGIKSMGLYIWNNSSDDRTYTIEVNGAVVKSVSFVTGKPANYTTISLDPTANNIVKLYGSNQIELYAIKTSTTGEYVPVGATGWSTYSSAYPLDFENAEDGIEAYAVTGFEGTTLTTSKITGTVAANTGLLVKGTAGKSYNVPVVATGDAAAGNKLIASVSGETVSAGTGDNVNYVLMNNGGTAEFQWIGTTSATLGANKAYLQIANGPKPTGSGSRGLIIDIDIDGVSTGINMVNGEGLKVNGSETYYDLQGRRILYPTKGLYIVNGKKVVIK